MRKILQTLPKGKAPGLDGMLAETLWASWSFIHVDCLAMVCHFWQTGMLPYNTTAGVMKIIPKKVDKH